VFQLFSVGHGVGDAFSKEFLLIGRAVWIGLSFSYCLSWVSQDSEFLVVDETGSLKIPLGGTKTNLVSCLVLYSRLHDSLYVVVRLGFLRAIVRFLSVSSLDLKPMAAISFR
jgi:hypothetical protein